MSQLAVYPGSFDPVTNGHIDIARRARDVFGEVLVLLMPNAAKTPLFSEEERFVLLQETFRCEEGIRVARARGLLTDFLKEQQLHIVVRGLRSAADIEPEFINAHYNKSFYPPTETIFLPTRVEYSFLSSSAVREAFAYGADVGKWVPPCVEMALKKKCIK